MKRGLLSFAILSFTDPALASGVRAGNIAPVMIAPLFLAGTLALLIGGLVSMDKAARAGWLVGGIVLVLTIVLSRLLAGFGFIAALCPQIVLGLVLLIAWRRDKSSPQQ
jgi:hypothetical protein